MDIISVAGLSVRYPRGQRPAVDDVSFAVAEGEIFGLLGPSGAGKSTTQKVLIKLLAGHSGAVRVCGRDIRSWGADYYTRIGVSFELPNHFARLSALENLRYFAALYPGPTRSPAALLEQVGLDGAAGVPVEQFSKGMRMRLNMARALLHSPPLLFLDEPTSGLDPVSAGVIKELIRAEQRAGRTIFLTTHAMALAEALCDRVAFMVDGAVAAIDTPRALKLRYGAPTVQVEYTADGALTRRSFPLAELATCADFQTLLRGGALQTIHSQEASLEQVFIQVTGRAL